MKKLQAKFEMTKPQIIVAIVGLTTTTSLVVAFVTLAIQNGISQF